MSFVTKKVFDYTDMPKNIQGEVLECVQDSPPDSHLEWMVHDWHKPLREHKGGKILYQEDDLIVEQGDDPVSEWLVENGAEEGEEVLIKLPW